MERQSLEDCFFKSFRHGIYNRIVSQHPGRFQLISVLSLGVLAISTGSILVRLSQEAPSLSIAFYRMFWAWLLLSPFYWLRKRPRVDYSKRWMALAGAALGLHFAFWIASLRFTSVAVSVLLVNTSPILVALLSYLLFRERLTFKGWAGIVLAFGGAGSLLWSDFQHLGDWRGAALALAGAAALGLYIISGRVLRSRLSLLDYIYPCYFSAALLLLILALVSHSPLRGFSMTTWGFLFLLGLLPQFLGHTSYNWSLRFLPATLVSMLVLAEPILATILAYWILDEMIRPDLVLGGCAVAAGIVLVSQRGIRTAETSPDRTHSGNGSEAAAGEDRDSRHPVEVSVGILLWEGRVWVQKRTNTDHLPGYWEFPGGKIEPGESPQAALKRELAEEVHWEVNSDLLRPLAVLSHRYAERTVRLHFFVCRLDRRPTLPSGRWVRADQLNELKIPEANRRIIRRLTALASE